MSSRRLVVIPAVLFLGVSACAFTLAKLHLARPGLPTVTGTVKLGDFYRGQTLFNQHCAACHGQNGAGGPVGPKLQGLAIPLTAAVAQIDGGGTTMPPGLVKGRDEADVLAYLATILATPSS